MLAYTVKIRAASTPKLTAAPRSRSGQQRPGMTATASFFVIRAFSTAKDTGRLVMNTPRTTRAAVVRRTRAMAVTG